MAWTDISNAAVAAGAALTTGLMTALRDNFGGLAARDTGAPKILGNPYDYQEFLTSGTWIKPLIAESGDIVWVQVVAGGASGFRDSGNGNIGGGGGGGLIHRFSNIDQLGATETIVVGAGALGSSGNGANGGSSSFGTASVVAGVATPYLFAGGGRGRNDSTENAGGIVRITTHSDSDASLRETQADIFAGGDGGGNERLVIAQGGSSVFGGGGGGVSAGLTNVSRGSGGISAYAGNGGEGSLADGNIGDVDIDGEFPGGGGGGVKESTGGDTRGGNGADGVVRVWCIKEQ